MYKKTALITGITGQDGAYLAKLLLSKGYKVYGTYRRTSSVNFWRIQELGVYAHEDLHLVEFDLTDLGACIRLLEKTEATEIYNLAAQSFVGVSFDQPQTTSQRSVEGKHMGTITSLRWQKLQGKVLKNSKASNSQMGTLMSRRSIREMPRLALNAEQRRAGGT